MPTLPIYPALLQSTPYIDPAQIHKQNTSYGVHDPLPNRMETSNISDPKTTRKSKYTVPFSEAESAKPLDWAGLIGESTDFLLH